MESCREYVVDLTAVTTWQDFIAAFNDGLIGRVGGNWDGNLNAFHDYLAWPEEQSYRLILLGWNRIDDVLADETAGGKPVLDHILEIFRDNPHVRVVRK